MNKPTCTTDEFGTKYWYLNDKLHREDGPAVEGTGGYKEWWLNGKLHRTDGPAVEGTDGNKYIILIEDWPIGSPLPDGISLYWRSKATNHTKTSSIEPMANIGQYNIVGINISMPKIIEGLPVRIDPLASIMQYLAYLHGSTCPNWGLVEWNYFQLAERIGIDINDITSESDDWLRMFCTQVFAYRSKSGKRSWEYEDPPKELNNV